MANRLAFNHVGIKCSDQQKSYNFYTKILGLKEIYRVEVMGQPCIFVGDDDFSIELEQAGPNGNIPDQSSILGLQHLCFYVTGIDEVAADLEARGAKFMVKPFNIRPERKTAFLTDPDGVMIQMIEDV